MENSRETVAWVGIAHVDSDNSTVFLPHGVSESSAGQDRFAEKLMRAIVRFAREYSRPGEGRSSEGPNHAALLAELATDYRENGLFSQRKRIQTSADGKPDWARTVKRSIVYPMDDGTPIFLDLKTTKLSAETSNLIAMIQSEVLAEIDKNHGWWIASYFGNRKPPKRGAARGLARSKWIKFLRLTLRMLFEQRAVRLVHLLIDYLESKAGRGAGQTICGISDFSTMWEEMLRKALPNVDEGWNSKLPRAYYYQSNGSRHEGGRMEIDIVLRRTGHFCILDAKYYKATSSNVSPGMPDVSKQIMYQMAFESIQGEGTPPPKNAFIFPARETGAGPFQRVEITDQDPTKARRFKPVDCLYVSTAEIIEAYAERRKIDGSGWLDGLLSAGAPAIS
ncbi:LlaJI family restriction endonuclease [Qipengyuania sp. S6317L1]|nr:LlaJI family restriction endonuclease [Qipengyuania sp. S6317L1]